MRFISFIYNNNPGYGLLDGDDVLVLNNYLSKEAPTLLDFVRKGFIADISELIHHAEVTPVSQITLTAPFPHALRNVICLGKNYAAHVNEVKSLGYHMDLPKTPIYFSKMIDAFTGPNTSLDTSNAPTKAIDYEVELAVIIGKDGKNISKEDAWNYIFGYSIGNDFSARDLQTEHIQWFRGKSIDGFCGFGPAIVTTEEFSQPPVLGIYSFVNGEPRQCGKTDQFIFDIPTIIADFSKGTTLRAGDIILTGTPAGVGAGFDPPRFLKSGDVVTCEIEGIGKLENHIK